VQTASFVLSLVAIATAIGSLLLAIRTDRRQQRAERREERGEERAEADARARRSGRPIVLARGASGGATAPRVQHNYAVRNGGEATITELWLWIEDGGWKRGLNSRGWPDWLGPR
jgi:hypothetical protein